MQHRLVAGGRIHHEDESVATLATVGRHAVEVAGAVEDQAAIGPCAIGTRGGTTSAAKFMQDGYIAMWIHLECISRSDGPLLVLVAAEGGRAIEVALRVHGYAWVETKADEIAQNQLAGDGNLEYPDSGAINDTARFQEHTSATDEVKHGHYAT